MVYRVASNPPGHLRKNKRIKLDSTGMSYSNKSQSIVDPDCGISVKGQVRKCLLVADL